MAYELPTDLITQLQISTRAQAGLSDYDPAQSSQFPGLPSLSENVAALDPSPPYLRCKHCKGRLLRDIQSLLCIYCGRLNDVALPDPISFKDTFGYSWLLQSLHLDGSEMVEPFHKKNESKRGQSTPKDNLPLSDFLNLKIFWSAESEKPNVDVKNKKVEQSSSCVTWPGVELDNFFLESKRQKGSSVFEQPVVSSNQVNTEKIRPVATHDNLSLFQNVQPSGNKDFDSSGWQADFQLADTGNKNDTSESFQTSIGSKVDLSDHIDSVFGSGKDLKDEKLAASSVSVKPTSDDFWKDSSEVFQQATPMQDNVNNPSTSSDWFQGDVWQTINKNTPQSGITVKDDNFDDWNDFTGLSTSAVTQGAKNEKTSELDLFSSENKFEAMDFTSFSEPDLLSGISDGVVDEHGALNKDILNSSTQPKDNVQMLISQMHDLSFMLETGLSIPSKSDNLNSFP